MRFSLSLLALVCLSSIGSAGSSPARGIPELQHFPFVMTNSGTGRTTISVHNTTKQTVGFSIVAFNNDGDIVGDYIGNLEPFHSFASSVLDILPDTMRHAAFHGPDGVYPIMHYHSTSGPSWGQIRPVSDGHPTWLLNAYHSNSAWDGTAIINVDDVPVAVTLNFIKAEGTIVESRQLVADLPVGGRYSRFTFPPNNMGNFYYSIEATGNIVVQGTAASLTNGTIYGARAVPTGPGVTPRNGMVPFLLAEGDNRIMIQSNSDTNEDYVLTGTANDGGVEEVAGTVLAGHSLFLRVEDVFAAVNPDTIKVTGNVHMGVRYRDTNQVAGLLLERPLADSQKWMIFPGDADYSYDTLIMVNSNDFEVTVNVQRRNALGRLEPGVDTFTVPANSSTHGVLTFDQLAGSYLEVQASGPVSVTNMQISEAGRFMIETPAIPLEMCGGYFGPEDAASNWNQTETLQTLIGWVNTCR